MADKKITELSVSQTIAADDSVFANIGGSARQVAVSLILALLEDVYAPLDSPALEGTPTAPTPADTDSSTRIATTAFLKSVLEDYAKLASPTFTGTPKTSTPISTDDSTRAHLRHLRQSARMTARGFRLQRGSRIALQRLILAENQAVAVVPVACLSAMITRAGTSCSARAAVQVLAAERAKSRGSLKEQLPSKKKPLIFRNNWAINIVLFYLFLKMFGREAEANQLQSHSMDLRLQVSAIRLAEESILTHQHFRHPDFMKPKC